MDFAVHTLNEQGWSAEQLICSTQHTDTCFHCLKPEMAPKSSIWTMLHKQFWMDQRPHLKHFVPQPLQSHLTGRWPIAGEWILVSDAVNKAQDACFVQAVSGACGKATRAEVDRSKQGLHGTPCSPRKCLQTSEGKVGTKKVFLRGFQGHTSIHSLKVKGASIFLSQTAQQTSLFQLGVKNNKQFSVPISAGWANALRTGETVVSCSYLCYRGLKPTCFPWQASFSTEKQDKGNRVRVIGFLSMDGEILS